MAFLVNKLLGYQSYMINPVIIDDSNTQYVSNSNPDEIRSITIFLSPTAEKTANTPFHLVPSTKKSLFGF